MANETELIKERLDLADVIGEYVPLKRVGAHFKGLCPFHQEKTPSFIVTPERGIWHCFGCQKGGDVFAFVQEIEGIGFGEALKLLAERAGVELRSRLRPGFGEAKQGKQRLFELLNLAAKFYHTILMQHEAGKKAKTYLEERGVKLETMREFEIGYAPMRWDTVQNFLQKKGFTPEEMIQAGLVGKGQAGKLYDRFRGRIMFPITDVQGRIMAFGGRIVPWHATGEEGKYINSPETALYEKRKTIYNLSRAKTALRGKQAAIVVEGYMDTVMLVQAGLQNVVASSGTAFTGDHIQMLKRYTDTLYFAFDADQAGEGATLAAAQAALDEGMRVATIVLPGEKDPADVVQKNPRDVKRIFSEPQSLVTVLLNRLKDEADGRGREEKLAALLPFLQRVRNVVLKGEMVREIASTLAIPEKEIIRLLGQTLKPKSVLIDSELHVSSHNPERQLLGLLLAELEIRQEIWETLNPELFIDEQLRVLYTTMHTLPHDTMDMAAALPPNLQSLAHALAALGRERLNQVAEGAQAEAQALIRFLEHRHASGKLRRLQQELVQATSEQRAQLLPQFHEATKALAYGE